MTPGRPVSPHLPRALATLALFAAIWLLCFVPQSVNDFWIQAKVGELIVTTGQVPHTLLFSFTRLQLEPFNAHEWLPSVLFYLLDHRFGDMGDQTALGVLGLALFALTAWLTYSRSGNYLLALLLSFAAMLVANYRHVLRPELFTLFMLVGLLFLLERYRNKHAWRWLAATLPLTALWANTHGSFLLAPVVAAIFAAGAGLEALRQNSVPVKGRFTHALSAAMPYAALALAMLGVAMLNPLGFRLLAFAFGYAQGGSDFTRNVIGEWQSTFSARFLGSRMLWVWLASLLLTLVAVVQGRKRLSATDALLLLAFTLLAATRIRFLVQFGFVAAYVTAGLIKLPAERDNKLITRQLAVGSVCLSVLVIALALRFGNLYGAYTDHVPSPNFTPQLRAVLAQPNVQGNVINSLELGDELAYRAYPRLRPLIDSRIDSYGDEYVKLSLRLLREEDLLRAFSAAFDVRYILVERKYFRTLATMPHIDNDWRIVHIDAKAVLLERRATP